MENTKTLRVKGRFAPTPSGRMHLGNVWSALLAWLSVRSKGGQFLLRHEDLDPQRTSRAFAKQLEEDLLWLGLGWEEGGSLGGPNGPYFQSGCTPVYEAFLRRLEEKARVYPCFCTRSQLHAANAPHLSDGRVLYDGHCRGLSPKAVSELRKQRAPALRVEVPDETVAFPDGCQGPCAFNLREEFGDFLIRRADGGFAYQFAVVADDGRMGVTEVVRGRDLLSSAAPQLFLYRLLGLPEPRFYHVPLLLAPDGRRLSKRDGDLNLGALRERFTPEALLGRLAFLMGQMERPEPIGAKALAACFSWEKVPREDLYLPPGLFQ